MPINPYVFKALAAINDRLYRNRQEPDWTQPIDLTVTYALPETATRCALHFNPRAKRLQDMLSMDWYRVVDAMIVSPRNIFGCKLQFHPATGVCTFVLTCNAQLVCAVTSERAPQPVQKILSVVINGEEGSLFRYHFPAGLDVSPLLAPVVEYLLGTDLKLYAEQIVPPVLIAVLGEEIKYDKFSLTLSILLDNTFEERIFHMEDELY